MFFSHRRILSLPVSPGSLSFQSSRKGTPTYSPFPHLFIVAQGSSQAPWSNASDSQQRGKREGRYFPRDGHTAFQSVWQQPGDLAWHADGIRPRGGGEKRGQDQGGEDNRGAEDVRVCQENSKILIRGCT